MHRRGIRFRKNVRTLPGKPDLANRTRKWAIFVHGCFWHSHEGCRLASSPKSNTGYWGLKLRRNRERDKQKIQELEAEGFSILILWECQTRSKEALNDALDGFFS